MILSSIRIGVILLNIHFFNYLLLILLILILLGPIAENGRGLWRQHPAVVRLEREVGLTGSCGYLTMVEIPQSCQPPDSPPPVMKPKERLRLPLRDVSELHCLDTPATPSSVEAWIKTMSGKRFLFT